MRRHRLRGMLLGGCMALLLASGVALAHSLSATGDKDCVQCWPGNGEPRDEYIVNITYGDWVQNPTYWLCTILIPPAGAVPGVCEPSPAEERATSSFGPVPCTLILGQRTSWPGLEALAVDGIEEWYGEWTFRVSQQDELQREFDSAEVSWLFAEDYAAAVLVPEPGTMLLLASGVAGLAGYTTLRWRAKRRRLIAG